MTTGRLVGSWIPGGTALNYGSRTFPLKTRWVSATHPKPKNMIPEETSDEQTLRCRHSHDRPGDFRAARSRAQVHRCLLRPAARPRTDFAPRLFFSLSLPTTVSSGIQQDTSSISGCTTHEKAKELLSGDKLRVTDVCFEVGFQSLGSFSSLFHKSVGHPPITFREKSRETQAAKRKVPGCFLVMYGLEPAAPPI